MTKRLLTVAVLAALGFVCSPQMHAAVDMTLSITDGNAAGTATITYDPTLVTPLVCAGGGCAALSISITGGDHGEIAAKTNNLGGFDGYTINITGDGGVASIPPELQNLDQINADRTVAGGGTLTTTFTDTNYNDLSAALNLSVSGTNGGGITTSKASFSAYDDSTNAMPATHLIGQFLNDTGASYSNSGTFANPQGINGSLTAMTVLAFSGVGTMQATFTIAQMPVPEPTAIVLFGTLILGLTGIYRKRQVNRP